MDDIEKNQIQEIILDLRQEIKNGIVKFPGSEDFPLGCCGNASEILKNRLYRAGIDEVKSKVNMWYNSQSHSWLVYKEHIIDITIDQFDSSIDFIISEKKSTFHQQFNKD